jgi:hypothetical protein
MYSSTPFVSAGRMQKKPALDKGIKDVMRILDRPYQGGYIPLQS